jgi:hypothetical protein
METPTRGFQLSPHFGAASFQKGTSPLTFRANSTRARPTTSDLDAETACTLWISCSGLLSLLSYRPLPGPGQPAHSFPRATSPPLVIRTPNLTHLLSFGMSEQPIQQVHPPQNDNKCYEQESEEKESLICKEVLMTRQWCYYICA